MQYLNLLLNPCIFISEGCNEKYQACSLMINATQKCCEGLVCREGFEGAGYCSYPSMYIRLLLMMYAFYYGI